MESMTPVIADTHVHLYPVHDTGHLLAGAWDRLQALEGASGAWKVLFLTETSREQAFEGLCRGEAGLPDGWRIACTGDGRGVWLEKEGRRMLVVAGRQIVCKERVEILALGVRQAMGEGLPAADVVRRVREAGGLPVLAWAPGKWMFGRAGVVRGLFQADPALLAGDSSLRCLGWPEPGAMRRKGLPVLAGSDPLPLRGEEEQAGRYAVRFQVDAEGHEPVEALLSALRGGCGPVARVGTRNPPTAMLRRLLRHHRSKTS